MFFAFPKFLTEDVAKRAIFSIEGLIFEKNHGVFRNLRDNGCHIVILAPSLDTDTEFPNCRVEPCLLYQESIGATDSWNRAYAEIAQCKTMQLWHRRNTGGHEVAAHLLFEGDAPFYGGVMREMIAVGCSGFQPWYDRMISGMIADMCIAEARNAWENSDDKKNKVSFLT